MIEFTLSICAEFASKNYTPMDPHQTRSILSQQNRSGVRLVRSGSEFFELLERMIRKSAQIIHFQTYIFSDDETGQRIGRALAEAALRGVRVYLVVDGYASQDLSGSFIQHLENAGIKFRFFDPVWKSKYFYFGRRLHHKVVVVDGKQALVGGINISNNYNDTLDNFAWLDWALHAEGDIVTGLEEICRRRAKGLRPAPQELFHSDHKEESVIRIRVNDWVRGKREITHTYLNMLRYGKSHVTILSSYFLPGKLFRKNLILAAKRGVRVKLIVAGVSDVKLAKYAERYMYPWLLRNNIEVYEYQRNVLHGKMGICDGEWLTLGSYNINNISAYASIELNLEVHDLDLARLAEQRLKKIIQDDCEQITFERYENKSSLFQRFLQRSAFDIFRITLFLFTFYFKQRE
jgi:cardiolipin synthase A/B